MVIDWYNFLEESSFWVFISSIFFAAVVSGLSVYVTKYLNKKAENFATKEDFDQLLEQIKESTLATEGIKSQLAEAGWLNQQSWNIREKYYTSLLIELNSFAECLGEELEGNKFREILHRDEDATMGEITSLMKSSKVHIRELRVLQGPAQMVISENVSSLLNNLHYLIWEVEKHIDVENRVEDLLGLQANIQTVQNALTAEAREVLIR